MNINEVKSVESYSLSYKAILCDLWGVIHNGVEIYASALTYLERMKEHGIDVYLISNAPRPNYVVQEGLTNKLGLNPDLYKDIYTSGDIGTKFVNKKIHGESYFHLGPTKDYDLLENINISKVDSINEADFILTTGLYDDSFETPKDYNDLFNDFIEKEKPIVCVNPDEIVYRGLNSIFCAGALGKYYEKLGGKVVYYGKPYVEIYDQAFQDLKNMNNIENKSDILAIGDSIKTDCLGAQNFNLDFVFIMNGIHKDQISGKNNIEDISNLVENILSRDTKEITVSDFLK